MPVTDRDRESLKRTIAQDRESADYFDACARAARTRGDGAAAADYEAAARIARVQVARVQVMIRRLGRAAVAS